MRVDAYASETHYAANVLPVLEALPAGIRGDFCDRDHPPFGVNPIIVASYNDLRSVGDRPAIFMEHGTGQTYSDDIASYAGARSRNNVALFLSPNQRVYDLNARTHPDIPNKVVGTPKLDPWWDTRPPGDVVGLAWHWDSLVCPEARSALAYYAVAFRELAERFRVIATAHPRISAVAEKIYADFGIPYTADPTELYRTASVLVCDNTSLGWEFIALDRPVVWCNAPWYRREIHHGLRFWDRVDAGIDIDEPVELCWAIDRAFAHDDKHSRRMEVADELYPYRDGTAAHRAVDAILELVGGKHGRRAAEPIRR